MSKTRRKHLVTSAINPHRAAPLPETPEEAADRRRAAYALQGYSYRAYLIQIGVIVPRLVLRIDRAESPWLRSVTEAAHAEARRRPQ
jgi:hypothetical protein